jgi:hypothetical protein
MVSQSVSLGVEPHPGLMTRYLLLFDSHGLVSVGRPVPDDSHYIVSARTAQRTQLPTTLLLLRACLLQPLPSNGRCLRSFSVLNTSLFNRTDYPTCNALDSYSRGSRFESWLGHLLFLVRFFVVFITPSCLILWDCTSTCGHSRFLRIRSYPAVLPHTVPLMTASP